MSAPICPGPTPDTTPLDLDALAKAVQSNISRARSAWNNLQSFKRFSAMAESAVGALLEAGKVLAADLNAAQASVANLEYRVSNLTAARNEQRERAEHAEREREDLADKLAQEHSAHARTCEGLARAMRELDRLRPVEMAARAVLGVCDTTTAVGQTEERLQQLGIAIDTLRASHDGSEPPPTVRATIANLIMLESMRAGAQGRDFNVYEAATLVEAWFLGKPPLPLVATVSQAEDARYDDWLSHWTDGRVAEREAQLRFVTEPFFKVAEDRLRRLCHEPIPDVACRELLVAYGRPVPAVPKAPPEAFTAQHALDPEMPGLPGREDGGHD